MKMRKTCKKLCDEIEKDPLICQYLNPKRFVGHGKGTHGMEWKAEQEPVLKEFHSGKCRLLVSTSVLEEGLDVPACNLVIRFDSVMSMRALIQSRGRAARRSDSRFVIMCNNINEVRTAYDLIQVTLLITYFLMCSYLPKTGPKINFTFFYYVLLLPLKYINTSVYMINLNS